MSDYISRWGGTRDSGAPLGVASKMEIVGERSKHVGPRFDFARVTMDIEPSENFEILNAVNEIDAVTYGYPDKFIFGLFDEILAKQPGPITKVRITLKIAEYDPIDSSPLAFFEAGRDAGHKVRAALGYSDAR